jgi:hypothetical protein
MPQIPINDVKVHHDDLVVATQGRAFWILDNLSSIRQMTPQVAAGQAHLYKPRDGYRTRTGANLLGPMFEYYLPTAATGAVTLDVLDGSGKVVNSYSSEAAAGGRGGRGGRGGGGDPDDPDTQMLAGRFGRGGAGASRVTKDAGINRYTWDVRDTDGMTMPPGAYQVRLNVAGAQPLTQPFNVLIDPRVAEGGVTVADLRAQYEHNARMRAMVEEVNGLVTRVRQAQTRLKDARGAAADTLKQVNALADKLITPPIRYSKPGLQAHISYLAGMTTGTDQKVGRDAIERYEVLRKELDAIKAEASRVLGEGDR